MHGALSLILLPPTWVCCENLVSPTHMLRMFSRFSGVELQPLAFITSQTC